MKSFFSRAYEIYKPFRKHVAVMFLLLVLGQAISLISPYFYGKIVDSIIGKRWNFVSIFVGASLISYIIGSIIGRIRDIYEIRHMDFDVSEHVADMTLRRMLGFSIGQHHNQHSGIKQTVIARGEHSLTSLAYTMAYEIIPLAIQVVFTIAVLLFLNFKIGLIVLTAIALFIALTIDLNTRLNEKLR